MKSPPWQSWRWGKCCSISPCFGRTDEGQCCCLDGEGHLQSFPHSSHTFEEHFEGLGVPIRGTCLQFLQFKI